MKRSSSRFSTIILSIALICIILATFPPAVLSGISAGAQFKQMWQRANTGAVCSYQTEIIQTAHPLPILANVGLSSTSEHIYIQGTINRPAKQVQMAMWEDNAALSPESETNALHHIADTAGFTPWTTPETSIHIRIDDDTLYGRVGSSEWEALDNEQAQNFMFTPGNDMLGYLESATNIQRNEPVWRDGTMMTRYTFDMDGQAFARYASTQIHADMQRRGKLPAGAHVNVPSEYSDLTGSGEMWVDAQGNPMHHQIHVAFPHPTNQETVEATIRTNYANWQHDTRLAWFVLPSLHRDDVQHTSMLLALLALLLAMMALLMRHWRSRRVYLAVASSVIVSLLVSPLLHGLQAQAFAREQIATYEEQQQQQATDSLVRQVEAKTLAPMMDPHSDPRIINRIRTAPAYLAVNELHRLATSTTDEDTTDTDNDGLTDSEETVYGTNPKRSDTDGDGLSDGVEVLSVGTSPINVDTDDDGISDAVEIRGFRLNNKTWYLSPFDTDSNRDGFADGSECLELMDVGFDVDRQSNYIQRTVKPSTACADTDGDGTPNVWDDDDDNDGVRDNLDSSPLTTMGGFRNQTLTFQLDDVTPGTSTFVDFQLRPTNTNHLWYDHNVLDWPADDKAGQVQRFFDTTFRDFNGTSSASSPSDANGDMRLIPMLEIEIPYEQGSGGGLPTTCNVAASACPDISPSGSDEQQLFTWLDSWFDRDEMKKYGIVVRPKDNSGTLVAYVPLNVVRDDLTSDPVAFSGRMYYRPNSESFGKAHKIRLAWTVQMIADTCSDTPESFRSSKTTDVDGTVTYTYKDDVQTRRDKWCADKKHWTSAQTIIHTYYDDWYMTGLSVQEDHGVTIGAIAQPSSTTQVYQSHMWNIARGLEKSFIAGRGDMTIAEVQRRFDRTRNANVSDTQRWGIPRDTFAMRVERFTDQTGAAMFPTQYTQEMLNTHYAGASQATMLFLFEESYRATSLDMDQSIIQTRNATRTNGHIQGSTLTVALDPAAVALHTNAMMNWATFHNNGATWEAASLDSVDKQLDTTFTPLLRQKTTDNHVLTGQITYLKSFYSAMFASVQRTSTIKAGNDDTLYTLIRGNDAALSILNAFQPRNGQDKTSYFAYLGSIRDRGIPTTVSTRTRGSTRAPINAAPSGLDIGITSSLDTYEHFVRDATIQLDSSSAEQSPWLRVAVKSAAGSYGMYSAVKDFKAIKQAKKLADSVDKVKNITKSARKASVAAAIVVSAISAGMFFYMWESGAIEPGTPAFKTALATMIAEIVVAIIFAIIEMAVPIGPIITAAIALFDATVGAICGAAGANDSDDAGAKFFCKGISGMLVETLASLFYDYTPLVDMEHADRLNVGSIRQALVEPDKGFVVGNSHAFNLDVTSKIFPNSKGFAVSTWFASDPFVPNNFRKTTVAYELTLGKETGDQQIHKRRDLKTGQIASLWKTTSESVSHGKVFGISRGSSTVYQYTPQASIVIPFQVGINWSPGPALFLAEGMATLAQECSFFDCSLETETSSQYLSLGPAATTYDVLPATLDEFYALDTKMVKSETFTYGRPELFTIGRLNWDDRFPWLVDADGDGLRSAWPRYGGNDPDDTNPDTDGDGVSDFYEIQHSAQGFDPLVTLDGDSLTTYQEVLYGTNPKKPDSDYDGLSDSDEINGWEYVYDYTATGTPLVTIVTSDPLDPDTDKDGITDSREAIFGTNPRVWTDPPFAIESTIKDDDGFVGPGQSFDYASTVISTLRNRTVSGIQEIDFSAAAGGNNYRQPFTIGPLQQVHLNGTVKVRSDITRTQAMSVTTYAGIYTPSPRSKAYFTPPYVHYYADVGGDTTKNSELTQPNAQFLFEEFKETDGVTSFASATSSHSTITTALQCTGDTCPQSGEFGQVKYGVHFDGHNDGISLVQSHSTSFDKGEALSLWVKPDEKWTGLETLVDLILRDDKQNERHIQLDLWRNGYERNLLLHITNKFQQSVKYEKYTWDVPLSDNTWSYVFIDIHRLWTYDERYNQRIPVHPKAYVNGYQLAEQGIQAYDYPSYPDYSSQGTVSISLGNTYGTNSTPFAGSLDEVMLWIGAEGTGFNDYTQQGIYGFQNSWYNAWMAHTIVIDAIAPNVRLDFDPTHIAKKDIVLPIVASDDASGIATVEYSVDDGATWQTPTLDEGIWTFTYTPPSAGRKFIRVRATDYVGNVGESTGTFIVDDTPPFVQFDNDGSTVPQPLTEIENTGTWTVTLSGSVTDNRPNDSGFEMMTVMLTDANGSYAGEPIQITAADVDTNGRWSVDYTVRIPLNEMSNVQITSVDRLGNIAQDNFTLALETSPPVADVAIASTTRSHEGTLLYNILAGDKDNLPIIQGTISEVAPPTGHTLLMHFEEPAGASIFRDSSVYQIAGECSGTACPQATSTDTYGTARHFDGNDMVTLSQGNSYRRTQQLLNTNPTAYAQAASLPDEALTVAAWVAPDAQSTLDGFVSALHSVGGSEQGWMLGSRGGRFTFALASADADDGDGFMTYLEAPESYTPGEWYHVVGTYDGTLMKIYVNGELKEVSDVQSGLILYPDSAWFGIGAYSDGDETRGFAGTLDEVLIYDRVLTNDDIARLSATNPVVSGVSTVQLALQHAKDAATNTPLSWQTVPLQNIKPQQRFASWSYTVPAGIEGPYTLSLRVTDQISNTRDILNVWSGMIDTRAPKLTFNYTADATGVRYTTVGEDFNISDSTISSPCGAGVVARTENNTDAWYQQVFARTGDDGTTIAPPDRTYRTIAECQFRNATPLHEIAVVPNKYNQTPHSVAVVGMHMLVQTKSGFDVIDLSNIQSPRYVKRYSTPERGSVQTMVVVGNYAYITYGLGGMDVIDVSTPTSPKLVGTSDVRTTMNSSIIAGSYAYVTDFRNRLRIITISDPTKPTKVGTYQLTSAATLVGVSGTQAYVAGVTTLTVLDVSNPASIALVATYTLPASLEHVTVDGTYMYGLLNGTLQIYNLATSTAPTLQLVGTYAGMGTSSALVVDGMTVYSAEGSYIRVVDVTNRTQPKQRSYYQLPNAVHTMSTHNGMLYAGAKTSIRVYDIGTSQNTVAAKVCDIFGNCTSQSEPIPAALLALAVAQHTTAPLQQAPAVSINVAPVPPVLAAAEPVAFTVALNAPNGLKDVTISMDGSSLHTQSWQSSPALTETVITTSAWTPASEGRHTLVVQATDQTGATTRDDETTLVLDTSPPTATVAKTTLTAQDFTLEQSSFALNGDLSDSASIADVSLAITTAQGTEEIPVTLTDSNGSATQLPATFAVGTTPAGSLRWRADWSSNGALPDGLNATLTMQVTDMAGHQTTKQQPLLIDATPPIAGDVTLSARASELNYRESDGTTMVITPGMTVSAMYEPQLVIHWEPANDQGSIDHYLAGWTTSPDAVASDLTRYPAGASSHTQQSSDLQQRYAHLIAVDRAGNQTVTTLGPIYVDYGPTPSYIAMNDVHNGGAPYRSWADSSCSLVGVDNRIAEHSNRFSTRDEQQQFSTTWDDTTLRLMWRGADWSQDGDLFIYLDTTSAGGSPALYDPYPASITNTLILLPPSNTAANVSLAQAQQDQTASVQAISTRPPDVRPRLSATSGPMAADALIWVQNSITATLLLWDGTSWKPASNGGLTYTFDKSLDVPTTDLAVSFNTLGIDNPAETTLSLLAVASEPDALRLWSTMPPRNNLNSTQIVDSTGAGSVQMFALTKSYTWKLANGVCPGMADPSAYEQPDNSTQNAPAGADVLASISSYPAGVAYSLLNDNLFFAMKDMPQFAGVDWSTGLQRMCADNPDDPMCQRTPAAKPTLNANSASVRLESLAPTMGNSGPFLSNQSTLDTVLDTRMPPIGDGNLVIYTLELVNEGDATARNVKADVYTWGSIRLPNGEHRTDTSGEYNVRSLDVGDLEPDQRVRVDFPAVVDTTFDPQNQQGKASIDVTVYDASGQHGQLPDGTDVYTDEIDRLFVEHELDTSPPDYIEILEPQGILAAGRNTISGFVYDRSAVPQIDIEVRHPDTTTRMVSCTDLTPDDGAWACIVDTGSGATGDSVALRVRATDTYGAVGAWSAWSSYTIDATPPTVQLDAQSSAALADGILGYADATMRGTISDNAEVGGVEVCQIADGNEVCEPATVIADATANASTNVVYDDVPSVPLAIGANTACSNPLIRTFNVTDTFTVERVRFGVNISHTVRGDLNVALQSPAGTQVMMLYDGTNASNYDVLIDDASPVLDRDDTISHDTGPGYYDNQRGGYSLLNAFKGQPATGTWKLSICDAYPASDDGAYNRSQLILTAPTQVVSTTATWEYTLPIVEPVVEAQDVTETRETQNGESIVFLPFVGGVETLHATSPQSENGDETLHATSPQSENGDERVHAATSLQAANTTLHIYGTDAQGNRTTTPLRYAYSEDTTPPEIRLTSSAAFTLTMSEVVTGSDKLRMSGVVSDVSGIQAMRLVVQTPDMFLYQDTIVPTGATWDYANAAIFTQSGTYKWWIEADDVAGNTRQIGPFTMTVQEKEQDQ